MLLCSLTWVQTVVYSYIDPETKVFILLWPPVICHIVKITCSVFKRNQVIAKNLSSFKFLFNFFWRKYTFLNVARVNCKTWNAVNDYKQEKAPALVFFTKSIQHVKPRNSITKPKESFCCEVLSEYEYPIPYPYPLCSSNTVKSSGLYDEKSSGIL